MAAYGLSVALFLARERSLPRAASSPAKASADGMVSERESLFPRRAAAVFLLSSGRSLLRAARILREGTPCCKRRHRRQRRQAAEYRQRIGVIAAPVAQRAGEQRAGRLR